MRETAGVWWKDVDQSRWALVRQLRGEGRVESRKALLTLARRYWYPVYLYVRRSGHAPEAAGGITGAFFGQLAAASDGGPAAPAARFRDWLLARVIAFLAGDWRAAAPDQFPDGLPAPAELEDRVRADAAMGGSPTQAYQRAFAMEVLARSVERLRAEARETGHLDMYSALEPYLGRDPLPGEYDDLARALDARPLAVVLALKRLRQRFRELAHEELTDTVSSAGDVVDEQRTLFSAINGGS